jgi:hypothetical protein
MDAGPAFDDRPAWARRIKAERAARRWSQADAVRALRAQCTAHLPGKESLLRNWKRWESGAAEPDDFYKALIAKTFGTVTAALFPTSFGRTTDADLFSGAGLDTFEVVARLRASDVSPSTLDALRIAADRLCCEYPHVGPERLHREGLVWLRRIAGLLDSRSTVTQHRELLDIAGWIALLVGCVEYDLGRGAQAEATRQAALSLAQESGDAHIAAWAHEMRAWYSLTQGDYRGVIAAAEAGEALTRNHNASVQLAAQRAKAWARMGDRRQVEVALNEGRARLEALPHPNDLDHHFVVDPAKFDFYAMDCYRIVGENQLAALYAHEVISASTDPDGFARQPMRIAEAQVTLGVVAGREGDLDGALWHGRQALGGDRKSLPSLVMCSRELRSLLNRLYPEQPEVGVYTEQLRTLT